MAEDSAIAKLAAKPIGTQIGVLCVVLLVVGGLYYQFSYSSGKDDLKRAKKSYKKLEDNQTKLLKREKEWKKLFKDKKELDERINTNQVSLPRDSDLNSFVDHLQGQAAVAGVSFKSWKAVDEVATKNFVKVPIAVQVVGNFHQILKYFFLLGDKETTKRIITIENFSLVPDDNGPDELFLKASFNATAFRQADGANPSAAKKAAATKAADKKSGIDKVKAAKDKREKQVKDATDSSKDESKGKTDDDKGAPEAPPSGLEQLKNPGAQP